MTQMILLTFYALVAGVFVDMTLREGTTGLRRGWDVMRVLGLLYCLVWPLIILHILFVAYRDRQARHGASSASRPTLPVEIVQTPVRHEKPLLERKRALDTTQNSL